MTVNERNLIIDDIISMLQKMENNSKQEEQEINPVPRLNYVSNKDILHNYATQ